MKKNRNLTIMRPKPGDSDTDYLGLIGRCVRESGYEILDFNSVFLDDNILEQVSIVNFNWYEGISQKHNSIKYAYFALRKIKHYMRMKKHNIRIIYTMHNKCSHNKFKRSFLQPMIDKMMIGFFLRHADKIVLLSEYSKNVLKENYHFSKKEIENKTCVINHISYNETYKDLNADEKILEVWNEKDKIKETLHVLFFGTLVKYKNIELIIELAKKHKDKNISFIFAGSVISEEYKKTIEKLCHDCDIYLITRFIKNDEVIALFRWADVCICPLDAMNSLNSGSMCLSFTLKTPVIGPRIGTILDFPEECNFSYSYKNNKEHYEKLEEALLHAYKEWQENPDALKEKGIELYNYIENNFSYEITKEKYKELYDSLL